MGYKARKPPASARAPRCGRRAGNTDDTSCFDNRTRSRRACAARL